jgi:diadenosine tetraphosphate (Ap4A) HIT family hydrolase
MPGAGTTVKGGCPACDRVALVASGGPDPLFISELERTVVFLHQHQPYPGWCVLYLKDHAEHLADLTADEQAEVFREVAHVAAAVRRAFAPVRINYECLGNQLHHVHWHVIPRYSSPLDPDPRQAVWARPASELAPPLDPQRAAEFVHRLQDAMERLGRV